jgi:uncharacterized protein DUF5658
VTLLVVGGLILLEQELLAVRNWSELSRARSLGLLDPAFLRPLWIHLVDALILAVPAYGGVMLAGIVIGSRGHRRLFAMPAALVVLLPVIGAPHQPLPLGYGWNLTCAVSCPDAWFANPWLGASLDLAVVLAPAFVLSRGVAPHRWPGPGDAAAFAAVGLAIGVAILVDRTALVVTGDNPNVPVFVAASAFGIAAGMRRPWWPWAHIVAVAGLSTALTSLVLIVADPFNPLALSVWGSSVVFTLEDAAPYVICVLVVSCWEPLAHLTRRAIETPISLVVAVNAMNLVDAVLTEVAIRSGGAVELNPVVRVGGIPLKLALVGVVTWLLYRRRPRALLLPAVVLAWVVCYHLSGIIVNR